MDFSKLNPKNWFRRAEAPKLIDPVDPLPPATPNEKKRAPGWNPDHMPKYKVGQRCLVLHNNGKIKMGMEVVLIKPCTATKCDEVRTPHREWAWEVDKSYTITVQGGNTFMALMLESWLMPLDDPKVEEELRNEVIDAAEQVMLNFARMSAQFDILAKTLEQQLKPKAT